MSTEPKDANNPSGPVSANNLTVTIDRDLCIGAATCIAIAPEVFALDNDAKAIVLESADDTSEDMIIDAAKVCPTAAIRIQNDKGEQVFP